MVMITSSNEWNDAPPNYENARAGSVQTVCVREINSVPEQTTNDDQSISYTGWATEESVSWRVHRSQFRSFHEAHTFCSAIGMKLPVPENGSQNRALTTLEGGNFYLGLTDEAEEGKFRSIHTDQEVTFEAYKALDYNLKKQ